MVTVSCRWQTQCTGWCPDSMNLSFREHDELPSEPSMLRPASSGTEAPAGTYLMTTLCKTREVLKSRHQTDLATDVLVSV